MSLHPAPRSRNGQHGQALVLMVFALTAVLIAVALVVDGGNVWAQQRMVQNGSDSSSEAGAIVMAQRMAGVSAPAGGWDAAVSSAIQTNAGANDVTVTAAYYTDVCGIPLKSDGSAALNADGTYDLPAAARVGNGLPPDLSATPDCPSLKVGPPAGVMVLGHRSVGSYFAGVVGISSFSVDTRATAVAGVLQSSCDATQGEACALLPVIFPVDIVSCDGSNNPLDTHQEWVLNQLYKVPLCKNGPGNVGWLDWTPPNGGTSELVQSILHPNNPAIDLPSWQFVTETGNVNSGNVENAINTYDGQVVEIPMFDLTCNTSPDGSQVANGPDYGCPPANVGGNGQNQWYRIPSFAFFQLCSSAFADCVAAGATDGAYVNGNNKSVCDTGNGATSCLVGRFVKVLKTGTVGPGVGGGTSNNPVLGVQLIK